MDVKIEIQRNFPFLKEYKEQFPITEGTIFVYKDTIYTNNELPYDVMLHEFKHLQQQAKIGAKKWIRQYLKSNKFRLEQELDAYKFQLSKVKETGDKDEYAHILIECCQNISSDLYGGIITYQEAIKLLK